MCKCLHLGPPRIPILGSYWALLKEDYYFSHRSTELVAKRYNTDILGIFLGPAPAIIPFGYDLCKEVLTREEFFGRNDTILTRGRSLGDLIGIFFVDGPYWKEQRRFSLRNLRDYGFGRRFATTEEHMEKEVRDLIELFTTEPKPEDKDICRERGQLLMPDTLFAPILNSILYMLVGRRFDNQEVREIGRGIMRFLRSGDGTGGAISLAPWLRYFAPNFFGFTPVVEENKRFTKFFQQQINEHKVNLTDDHQADLIDTYLSKLEELKRENETETTFSEKQLIWTLIDFMFPAPVAIGQTLNCLWVYLVNYPEIQERIQEEIDRVVGRSRLPNLDDRKDMPYTEAVIRETLRKDPINPLGISRRCMQDTYLRGYFVPKDTVILPHLWSACHDVKKWKDPENFRPERFLNRHGDLLKKDYTIGFGAGKRLCAGETFSRQTMFLLVSGLLQNFSFAPADEMPDPKKKIWGVLLSSPEFWVKAISR
ncbi:hypothetical protein ILUMI_24637 [Ignelater luminosus]|uniref:Cytochrome P450 n=1 Tax=Ignelater luminosus TaxID=2038154 RepID=A0A8K0G0S9_IGNLU|nr:hypothetical protein ILUMI_24637 [Ignelater luminosus]